MAFPRIRAACRALHRWIGIALAVLLVPVSLTGAARVWHDHLDAMVNPGRYAVADAPVARPLSDYLANAKPALLEGLQPSAVRFPAEEGWPLRVMARGVPLGELGPPRIVNVYLDPPTGRVLDVVDFRSPLVGWLHRSPLLNRPGFGPLARDVRLTPDDALAAAMTAHPGARPVAIFLPTAGANAARGRAPGEAAKAANNTGPLWRVQLRGPDDGDLVTLSINDRTGDVVRMPAPLAGDRAALWMDPAHSRQRARRAALASAGVRDRESAGAVCGHLIWLRGRHLRRVRVAATAKLQAAE